MDQEFSDVSRPILFILSLALFANGIWAQEPVYRHIGLGQGLLSHLVYSTFQDRDGYVWFATDEGACRYDGYDFEYFTTDQGLCDNEVLGIDQDSKGRIWFLTLSGCLSYYYQGKIYNAANEPALAHSIRTIGFTGISEDDQGNVYIFGLSNELLKFDGQSITSQKFFPKDHMLPTITFGYHNQKKEQCYLNRGELFRCVDGQLIKVTDGKIDFLRTNCFAVTDFGPVFIKLDEVCLITDSGVVAIGHKSAFPNWDRFMSLRYHGGSFWCTLTNGGIEQWKFNEGKWALENTYLQSAIVNSVMQDEAGNIWFSTRDQGIYFLPLHVVGQSIYLNNPEYQVVAMVELPRKEGMLIGTDGGDIFKISAADNYQVHHYTNLDTRMGMGDLAVTSDGRVICVNHKGLFWLENGKLRPISEALNNEIPKCFALDRSGGIYVFGLIRCVHIPDLNAPQTMIPIGSIANERVYHMKVDFNGALWYEQHDKMYRYYNGEVKPHDAFNDLSKGRVSDIELSHDGRIVVATYGSGVFVLSDDRIDMQFNVGNGLNSNECRFILCDNKSLYLHTSAGLWRVECSEQGDHKPHLITSLDHLANKKMNAMVFSDNRFFFGTHAGMYSAPYNSGMSPIPALRLILESINQKPIDNVNNQTYQLEYGQSIHIAYTAIGFGWVDHLEFEYRIRNQDTAWVRTSARGVDFSNMRWGPNIFELRARHPYGEWSPVRTMTILVAAPFYASWWFRSLVFILFLSIIYYSVEYYLKRLYAQRMADIEQERVLLAERNRISTDLHDEIGAEVSNIVILARIAQAKIKNNDSPRTSIDKIDRAANDMINKMNGIIWSLNPGNDDLVSLVEYLKRYCNDYFELHHYGGGIEVVGSVRQMEVKGIVRRNIFLILKECLQNVYKHSRADFVKVMIKIEGRRLVIEIHDNGVGFDQNEVKRGRLGVQSLKRRAQDIGGNIVISSKLGVGTTVVGTFAI